jgi:hypothetical protein
MRSIGPDFFSENEHIFCDMTERRLYPVCVNVPQDDFFDPFYNKMRRGDIEKWDEQAT